VIVKSEEGLLLYALSALLWLGFVAFILACVFMSIKESPLVAIVVLGVLGWLAWKWAGKLFGEFGAYVNFGTVQLALERAPVVGGELRGAVEFESGAAALAEIEAELVCTRKTPDNDGGSVKSVVHSETYDLAVHVERGHRVAPFAFAIPADACASGEEEGAEAEDRPPTYTWVLKLSAENAGGDLARSFEVDVLPAGATVEEVMARQASASSGFALVAANLLPLVLVFLGYQDIGGLVVLYWAENLVIGFYTVLRMLAAGRGWVGAKLSQSFFFCLHYGMFCLVHGILVMAMFMPREQYAALNALAQWPFPLVFVQMLWEGGKTMGLFSPGALLLPLLGLVASQGVSFYTNYLRSGRYRRVRPQDSFWRPYPRMVLLHLCIIGVCPEISDASDPLSLTPFCAVIPCRDKRNLP
jgi:uncharacterized protein DUF6498